MFISLTTLGLISAAAFLSIVRMPQLSTEIDSRRDGRYPIYHTKRNNPNVDLYQHSPPLFMASTSVGKHQLPKPEKRHLLERFVNRIFRRPTKADIPPSRYRTRNHRPSPIMTPSLHQFPHLMGSSEPFPFMVSADGAIIEQPSFHHSGVRFPGESISYNNPPLLAESNSHYSYQFGQPAPMKPERNIHWPHSKTTYNNQPHHSEFPSNHHSSSSMIQYNKPLPSIGAPPSMNKQKNTKSSYSTKLKKLIFYHGNGAPKHRKYRHQYQYDHPHRPGDGMVETVDEHHYFYEDEDNNDEDEDDGSDEDGDDSENIDEEEEDDEIKQNQKGKLQKDKEEIDEKLDNRKYYTKFENTAQQPSLPSDEIYRNNSLLLLSPSKHRYRYADHRRTKHHGKSKPTQSTDTNEDEMSLVNCPPPGGTSGKPINYHYHMYLVKQGESDSSQDVYPGGGIQGPDSSSPSKIYYPLKDNHKNHNHKKKSSHKPTTKDHKVPKTTAATTTTTAKVPNHRYSDYQQHTTSDDGSTFYYQSSGKDGATYTPGSHSQTGNHQLNSDYYNRILMKKIFDLNPGSKVMPIENYITESSASLNSPTNYGNQKRPAKFEASKELKMDTNSKLYVSIAAASSKAEETLGSKDTKKKSNNGGTKSKKLEINSTGQKEIII